MDKNFEKLLEQYNYQLPEKLIAQEPSVPRDAARLLVYNSKTDKNSFDVFRNIGKHLPKNAVLVFNETKVIPARLSVRKETGGKAEIFYISHGRHLVKIIADRKLQVGSALLLEQEEYPAKRGEVVEIIKKHIPPRFDRSGYSPFLHPGQIGKEGIKPSVLSTSGLFFTVTKQQDNFYFLKPSFPISKIISVLARYGKTPLPPYIKHSKLSEKQRREKYQTVFAKAGLSVAAPTASLHFTKQLIASLQRQGREVAYVNLNVGLGTFAPLKRENIKRNLLHAEYYHIPKITVKILRKAKKEKRPIIAVGTTVVRTLESSHGLKKPFGDTQLFIREGYRFKIIDGLVTNFHVPKSSLMMLVSAFVGRKKLLDLYGKAIRKKMRFFSFGDGMLIV